MPTCRFAGRLAAGLLMAVPWAAGCDRTDTPPAEPPSLTLDAGTIAWRGRESVFERDHRWKWERVTAAADTLAPTTGTARMGWPAADKRYARRRPVRWALTPAPGLPARLRFIPEDTALWHTFTCEIADAKARPEPILRIPVESSDYDDLLDLACDLTSDHFDQVVRHWPAGPVPVRSGTEVSGEVDLSACLRRAVAVWNEGEREPWFVVDESADRGVRLLHYRAEMHPPLQAQLTRQDVHGNPVRMNIRVGDNYRYARDTTYVVRGMIHELAHTLLLWGHSTDRNHCLWGAAPPLVNAPSPDERKAAQLVRDLPEGLDLKNYRRFNASG